MKKLFLLAIIIIMASCENYSTGERIGVITKVSEKGRLFKSMEIEMKVAPGMTMESQQMIGQYETFSASIDNDYSIKCITPIEDIKTYLQKGYTVIVEYQETSFKNIFSNRGETNYFVKSVTPLNIEGNDSAIYSCQLPMDTLFYEEEYADNNLK